MTTKIYRNHSQMFSHMVVRCAVFSVITMVSTIFCLNPLLLIREVHITPVKQALITKELSPGATSNNLIRSMWSSSQVLRLASCLWLRLLLNISKFFSLGDKLFLNDSLQNKLLDSFLHILNLGYFRYFFFHFSFRYYLYYKHLHIIL